MWCGFNRNLDLFEVLLKNKADVNNEYKLFGNTPLHHAALANYPEIIEMLVNHGADVNLQNKNGWTALHLAARHNPELSQTLLDHGADVNSKHNDGWTALHFVTQHNPELSQTLLDHGADVNSKDNDRWTALHYAAIHNPELSQTLIDHGADVNSKDNDGWTALHVAARYNPELSQTLLDHGAYVYLEDSEGRTALHDAARYNPKLALKLIDHAMNADILESKFKNEWTALHLGMEVNCPESVQKLLVKGADVNSQNGDGCKALQLAKAQNYRALEEMLLDQRIFKSLKLKTGTSALTLAIESNNLTVAENLINNGGDLTVQDEKGINILQHALKNFEMVKYLHEKNSELVKQVTNDGSTYLHLAIDNDDCPLEVILWLIEDIKIDVNGTNEFGETPFMIACSKNRSDVVEYLLTNKGIDLSKEDRRGGTALHHAVTSGCVDLVQNLLDRGADLTKKDNYNRNVLFYGLKRIEMILYLSRKNMEFVKEVDSNQSTLLMYAIIDSYVVERDVVHWLIEESGIDLNAVDQNGNSAINCACVKRMWDFVEILLTKDVDIRIKNANGENLLHLAAESGNSDLVQKLIERGINPTLKDNLGKNTLHYALQHFDIVKHLDRELAKEVTEDKNTSLHLAINMYDYSIEVIRWLLDEAQVDVNAKNENGETALMTACSKNRFDVIQILLENKADVSIQDNKGRTALHHAARSGHLDMIKMLFDHMASEKNEDGSLNITQTLVELVKHVDKEDNTLLTLAMESNKKLDEKVISWLVDDIKLDLNAVNCNGESALLLACKHRKWDAVDILLSRDDTDIGSKDQKERTALHWAAASGNLAVVQRLVERGADLTLKDSDGMNVMHHALRDVETVKVFHKLNKELVTEITKNGSTCLHLAVIRGSPEVIRWLIDEGIEVDLDKSNYLGLTALSLACRRNMWEVVGLLVENNVDISKTDRAGKNVLNYAEEAKHFDLVEKLRVLSDPK
ncbi:serine/threonine-protein phosphatase 6 regulatory ankyrin repeat subunit B-like [Cloeon dipterum]|uniref:serine/threonine-protein phosphatase 6 regulatory ankyrin repeat subunit B-like n=1 Tax=Cloeon dipterum TaxID=197152 RepID=UPI00322064C7